ncbi:MAG: hypothetical protein ABWK53_01320 [Anaerolineales bacterium]
MNWRKVLFWSAVLLLLGSFMAYGLRINRMILLARDWPSYSEAAKSQAIDLFGLDRPLAVQHGVFLVLFVAGILLAAAYGMYGLSRPAVQHSLPVKTILVLSLLTNVLTALRALLLAPTPVFWVAPWWYILGLATLGLAGFIFSLAIWQGRKWGMYGLVCSMGLAAVFEFLGGTPWLNVLFTFSLVIVLWLFLRPVWWQME